MMRYFQTWPRTKADWISDGVVVGMVGLMIATIVVIGNRIDGFNSIDNIDNPEFSLYNEQVLVDEQAENQEATSEGMLLAEAASISTDDEISTDQSNEGTTVNENTTTDINTGTTTSGTAVGGTTSTANAGLIPTSTPTPSPTPTAGVKANTVANPTATPTTAPQATATPTNEPTPTEASVARETKSVSLAPDGSATPSASGQATLTAIKNSNGYWDVEVGASFLNLQPNRNYQLWLCGTNCSSHTGARFTTNEGGAGSVNSTINHSQGNDPMNRVMVWEVAENETELISNGTTCFQANGAGCVKGDVSW